MTQGRDKVLLVYPSRFKISGLHIGLASLSAFLRKGGYDVKIFNTAFRASKRQLERCHNRQQPARFRAGKPIWHPSAGKNRADPQRAGC